MARTFEETLKFDNGLTVEIDHSVELIRNGKSCLCVVYIPRKGYPRLVVKANNNITKYKVMGNDLVCENVRIMNEHMIEQWPEKFEKKIQFND